jgi:hypothetical protein
MLFQTGPECEKQLVHTLANNVIEFKKLATLIQVDYILIFLG